MIILYFQIFILTFSFQAKSICFYDSFENLNNWERLKFASEKKPTKYQIINGNKENFLQIKSDSSSSGLICKTRFNPNQYPLLQWKWKVSNIIPNIDGRTKEGDDYAIRIFVMFEKDSSQISLWEKIENSALEIITGYSLPYKSLCYVWANSDSVIPPYLSPYSDDVLIIPLQSGSEKCNQWIVEKVNIANDFKKYFKEKAPVIAGIAISGDTDNTKSSTNALLDYIKLTKKRF